MSMLMTASLITNVQPHKKIAILQSNYIPWKGYFDLINSVDEFILYDDMQYTRRDWRNRNKIKTPQGLTWLTIPVEVKGKYFQKIKETLISDSRWGIIHWKSIQGNYARAKHFNDYKDVFEEFYRNTAERYLSQVNYQLVKIICGLLRIKTKISWSTDYVVRDGKTERLIDLCQKTGATEYISGPAAKDYIETKLFEDSNIKLTYFDYSGYSEYRQLFPPFEHGVSIIDLLFNEGPKANQYMKSFKTPP